MSSIIRVESQVNAQKDPHFDSLKIFLLSEPPIYFVKYYITSGKTRPFSSKKDPFSFCRDTWNYFFFFLINLMAAKQIFFNLMINVIDISFIICIQKSTQKISITCLQIIYIMFWCVCCVLILPCTDSVGCSRVSNRPLWSLHQYALCHNGHLRNVAPVIFSAMRYTC